MGRSRNISNLSFARGDDDESAHTKKVISDELSKYLAFRWGSMSFKRMLDTRFHLLSNFGNLFLKARSRVRSGETVLDKGGMKVGEVFDFFSFVSKPFLAVKPVVDEPESYVCDPFFLGMKKR